MSVISRLQPRRARGKRAVSFNVFSANTIMRRKPASQRRPVLEIARPQPQLRRPVGQRRRHESSLGWVPAFASSATSRASEARRRARESGKRAAAYALIPMGVGAAAMGQESKRSRKKPALLGLLAAAGLVAVAKRDRLVAAIDQRRGANSTVSPAEAPAPAPVTVRSAQTTTSGQIPS